MNIASRKLRLIFEMKLGEATSSLVSEIFRAIEGKYMCIIIVPEFYLLNKIDVHVKIHMKYFIFFIYKLLISKIK